MKITEKAIMLVLPAALGLGLVLGTDGWIGVHDQPGDGWLELAGFALVLPSTFLLKYLWSKL